MSSKFLTAAQTTTVTTTTDSTPLANHQVDDDAFSIVSTAAHAEEDDQDINDEPSNDLLDRFLLEAGLLFATVHRGSYLWNYVESLGAVQANHNSSTLSGSRRSQAKGADLSQVRNIQITSYVGNRALIALCSTIRLMLPNVTSLSLASANIYAGDAEPSNISGNTAVQAMCSLLCGHPSLRTLDMSGNDIGVAALQFLVALAKGTPSLLSIELRNTCVTNADRWQLDAVLAVNKRKQERGTAGSSSHKLHPPGAVDSDGSAAAFKTQSMKLPANGVASFLSSSSLLRASQKMSTSHLLSPKKSTVSSLTPAPLVVDDMGSLRNIGALRSATGSPRGGPGSPQGPASPSAAMGGSKRSPLSIPYLRSKKDPYILSDVTMRHIRSRLPPNAAPPSVSTRTGDLAASLVPWPRVLSNIDMTKSTDGKAFANIAQLMTPAWLKGASPPTTDAQRVAMRAMVRRTCVFQAVAQQLFLVPPRPPAENGGVPLSVQAVGGMVGKSLAQADFEAVLYRQRLQQDLLLDAVVDCLSLVQLNVGESVWEKGDHARNVYLIALPSSVKDDKLAKSSSSPTRRTTKGRSSSVSASPDFLADASIVADAVAANVPPQQQFGAVMSLTDPTSSGKSSPSLLSPMMSSTRTQGGTSVRLAPMPALALHNADARTIPQGQFFGYDEALPIDSTTPPTRVRTTTCVISVLEGPANSPRTPLQRSPRPADQQIATTGSGDAAEEDGTVVTVSLPRVGSESSTSGNKVSVWSLRREAFEMFFSEPLFAQRMLARRIVEAMPCMLGVDPQLRLYLGDVLMNPTVILEKELPLSTVEGTNGRVAPESVDVVPFTQLLDHVILVEEGSMCVRRQGQEMSVFGRGEVIAFDGRPLGNAPKSEACEGLRCVLKTGNMPSWKFHVLALADLRRALPLELVDTIAIQSQKNFKEVDARLDNSGWGRRSKRTPM